MNGLTIAKVAVALLLIGAGSYFVLSYQHMTTQVAELAPLKEQVVELQGQYTELSKEVVRRAADDARIRAGRRSINSHLDEVTNEDSAARAYLGERIPDGVRAAYLTSDTGRKRVPAANAH